MRFLRRLEYFLFIRFTAYLQHSATGDNNFFFFFFLPIVIVSVNNITGGTITHRRVHFLFESFSTNMLIHTSEDLAGGSDNTVCS